MKIKILAFTLVLSNLYAITPSDANRLKARFNIVGIYDPTDTSSYNEAEAANILNQLNQSRTFKGWTKDLRIAQLESLQQRTRTPAPPRDDAELERLRQENAQLRRQNLEILNISRNIATGHNNTRAFTAGAGASLQHMPADIPGALNNIREALERIRQMGNLYDQLGTYLNP